MGLIKGKERVSEGFKGTVRIDENFKKWVDDNLGRPHGLSMRESTFFIGRKLKGFGVVEVKKKKLTLRRLAGMDVSELFDEIKF